MGCEGRLQHARPAEPLKPRRDLGVIQVGIATAAGTGKLECLDIAAFHPAVHDADPEMAADNDAQSRPKTAVRARTWRIWAG
jgi:hypothetical protein